MSEHNIDAIERATMLIGAMMDETTAPELRERIAEWFESPSGWDAKGEALERYMHRELTPSPVAGPRTVRSKAEFLRQVGVAPAAARRGGARRRIYFRVAAVAAILFAMVAGGATVR